jgi:hypothetical protein
MGSLEHFERAFSRSGEERNAARREMMLEKISPKWFKKWELQT